MRRLLSILGLFIAALAAAASKTDRAPSFCDVPVVVADYYNKPVPNLTAADFSVRLAGTSSSISSASVDAGPKRVALILDASGNVPDEELKLETQMAGMFLKHARADDQFVLIVIGGAPITGSFLSATEVTARVQALANARPIGEQDERIYDALQEAVGRLNPVKFGDTIFLLGHHKDSGSKTTIDEIQSLILKKGLRFLAVSFADKLAALPAGTDLNKPLPKEFRRSELETLSANTGYYFSFHAVRSLGMQGQTALFEDFLGGLYTWIAEPYRLQFSSSSLVSGSSVEISVSAMESRKMHAEGIHYPQSLSCPQQPQGAR
jgi:hypothetical protein